MRLFRLTARPQRQDPILFSPRVLLVGQTNEQAAKSGDREQRSDSDGLAANYRGAGRRSRQPAGKRQPVPSPAQCGRLAVPLETAAIPGNSTTAFYLFGDPRAIAPIYVTVPRRRGSPRRSRQRKRTSAPLGCGCVPSSITEWGLATTARRTSQPGPDRIVSPPPRRRVGPVTAAGGFSLKERL